MINKNNNNNNNNKTTLQRAREALREIGSAIRGAEYVDDTWATVDVDVLKLCRDLLHKSIGLVKVFCPDDDGDDVDSADGEPVEREREMTYLEKYVKEYGALKGRKTPLNCPGNYGYEVGPDEDEDCPKFPNGRAMDCIACWNRKMPKGD